MVIDDYLKQAREQNSMVIHPSWGQGRTTFGGLSAALLLEKMQSDLGEERYLRSLNVNFCGPLLTDTPFQLEQHVLAEGKSISHITGQAWQAEKVVTQLTACFGVERDSTIEIPAKPLDLGEEGAGQRLSYIKGLTPEFVQHVEFSYCKGGFPFTNSQHNHLAGWVRFKEPTTSFTESHLVALIDAWPPTVLQKLKQPAPCASVTWSLELAQPLAMLDEPLKADSWIYYDAEIKQAHHGYAHTVARIYHPNGQLIALSRQLVAVYDKR